MKIEKTEKAYGISWEFPLKSKERRRINTNGVNTAYIGAVITIPKTLINIISKDETYYYMYEHFEKICVTPEEPPKEVKYKKLRLNKISKRTNYKSFTEVSTTFFDISTPETIKFTYYPDQPDYITGKEGRIEVTTHGEAPRKHIRRTINLDTKTIQYQRYITQTHTDPEIVFHEEIKQIIPETVYIYKKDNNVLLTSKEPDTDYIHTSESGIIPTLEKEGLINNATEKLVFGLSLESFDEYSEDPQISMIIDGGAMVE